MDRFWAYESALMSNDTHAMAELSENSAETVRGDAAGLLVRHGTITAFRANRGGAPARSVLEIHRRNLAPGVVLLIAVTQSPDGGRGQQTQVWRRSAEGPWGVSAAHVSTPAPAMDTRIWRVVGDPLVGPETEPSSDGRGREASPPLAGCSVAVKDLFAVAGHRIGAGSPAWLAEAEPEARHAPAVRALLAAGAHVRGLARTDEFAYSLAGTNTHYGTPPNSSDPHRIPGGSTSGSASAVSSGQADIGLGTDTGGSIRVPSAYQGLWGLRTTHGLVSRDGVLPLAPSFDTVGWVTRSVDLLSRVTRTMVHGARSRGWDKEPQPADGPLVLLEGLLKLADDDVAQAVRSASDAAGARSDTGPSAAQGQRWRSVFQSVQAGEAWAQHGEWIDDHWDRLAPDVASRFAAAREQTADSLARARVEAGAARRSIRELAAGRILVLPSASSVAPLQSQATAGGHWIEAARAATMALTSLAGLAGLPVVSVPVRTADGLPCGLSLIGPEGSDESLVRRAAELWGDETSVSSTHDQRSLG
ncbi:DUF3225 domain-containing protein [Kocuria sp. JC486]|nr:AtzH-like domain-containing protein [Kocuria sp. JC486]NHU86042.1 DUF3225 domain-containing protein [Kocuria sp. JC486]